MTFFWRWPIEFLPRRKLQMQVAKFLLARHMRGASHALTQKYDSPKHLANRIEIWGYFYLGNVAFIRFAKEERRLAKGQAWIDQWNAGLGVDHFFQIFSLNRNEPSD